MFGQPTLTLGNAEIAALVTALGEAEVPGEDTVRIDRIRLLEELKSAAAAAQARVSAAFVTSQRAEQSAAGVPAERVGRGIVAQVGLARRVSPYHAARYVGWSMILTSELPHTLRALTEGRISERRAMLVARETAWLSREHRAVVDAELGPRLESLGDRRTEAETKRLAYRLDPHGYVARVHGADADRHVSVRPAPDAMGRLTTFATITQTVAAYACLARDADAAIAAGDPRGRAQIMADTAIARLTGQASAAAVPVEIQLIMPADTLLAAGTEPAELLGYGPVPAEYARRLALGADEDTPIWLRRLFTSPRAGDLIAMDSRRRCFTPAQRRFISARDRYCRTPWCEAPIRHADHITAHDAGGRTHTNNGQGYCQACNYAKQAPGWITEARDGSRHPIEISTPTGHHYQSRAPDLPGGIGPPESGAVAA